MCNNTFIKWFEEVDEKKFIVEDKSKLNTNKADFFIMFQIIQTQIQIVKILP